MRWFGYKADPIAGGTNLDDIAADPAALLTADTFVPVTTAQVDPGVRDLPRDDDVRGRRANAQPITFASAPELTLGSRAWTRLARDLLRRAMGGSIASVGAAPASVQSTIQMLQEGNLPALQGTIVREGEVDRVTGLWINELTFDFPADAEGTIEATLMGLYHQPDATGDVGGLPAAPAGMPNYVDAYMLRDLTAIMGDGAGVPIDCVGGFGFTLNNNLSDDFRTRFCAGKNVLDVDIDGENHRLWYPNRNKLGPQAVTGRLDYGDVQPDRELRRIVRHAEKLVVELAGPPLGTTPAADEMLRLVFYKQAPTGGGPEPLQRDGDQQSSYEFTAYLDDATGKDLEAVSVGTAALV